MNNSKKNIDFKKPSIKSISYLIILFFFVGLSHDFYHDHTSDLDKAHSHCCENHEHNQNDNSKEDKKESKTDCPVYLFLAGIKISALFSSLSLVLFGLVFLSYIIYSKFVIHSNLCNTQFQRGPPALSVNI